MHIKGIATSPLLRRAVVVSMAVGLLSPVAAHARTQSGAFYINDNGTSIEIVGCADFSCPKALVVPEKINGRPVTAIGMTAFGRSDFDSISLPKTLTRIETSAFNGSSSASAVTIPASVAYFGMSAFGGFKAPGLTYAGRKATFASSSFSDVVPKLSLNLSGGYIDQSAFSGVSFSSVTLGPQVRLEQGSFSGGIFVSTPKIDTLSVSMPVIPTRAFQGVEIGTLTLGSNVKVISSFAFGGNIFGEKINIGSVRVAAPMVDSWAFVGRNFTSLTLTASVQYVGSEAFSGCNLGPAKIDAVNLAARSFTNSTATSLTLGPSVQLIGDSAFSTNDGSSSLGDVSIAAGSIAPMAFSGTPMTKLTIGMGVKDIASSAFSGVFTAVARGHVSVDAASVGSFAFSKTSMDSLTLGSHVRYLGSSAFVEAEVSGSINIAAGTISPFAFYRAKATSLTVGKKVASIGDSAFASADLGNLMVDAPDIGFFAFYGVSAGSVVVGENVRNIRDNAFSSMVGVTNMQLKPGVQTIGDYAFSGLGQLTTFAFPNTVRRIGDAVLNNASSLTTIDFGLGVQAVGAGISNSDALTLMTFHGAVPTLGSGTPANRAGLTVRYPESQKTTWQAMFASMEGIPDVVTIAGVPVALAKATGTSAPTTAKTLAFVSNAQSATSSAVVIKAEVLKPPARRGGKATYSLVCSKQSRIEGSGTIQAACTAPTAFRTALKKKAATYRVTVTIAPDVGAEVSFTTTVNLPKK